MERLAHRPVQIQLKPVVAGVQTQRVPVAGITGQAGEPQWPSR